MKTYTATRVTFRSADGREFEAETVGPIVFGTPESPTGIVKYGPSRVTLAMEASRVLGGGPRREPPYPSTYTHGPTPRRRRR